MTSPPLDPYTRDYADDSYRISGRDMEILKDAVLHRIRARDLEREIVSLRQTIDRYQERYGEL